MQSSPAATDLQGAEWSVRVLHDGTIFMLNGMCDYFLSRDRGASSRLYKKERASGTSVHSTDLKPKKRFSLLVVILVRKKINVL